MPENYQLELRHFRYFQKVAEMKHFRNAAEALFITQPGLSRQIKMLEETLGVQLFERTKREVKLTAAGYYLKREVDLMINHLDRAVENVKLVDKGEQGEVRIGFVGSAMLGILPDLLKKMNKEFPKMHTRLDQLGNKEQLEAIQQDRLDIGFVRSEKVPVGLVRKELVRDTFSVVLPTSHTWRSQKKQSLADLCDESFILFSRDYSYDYYDLVMSIFDHYGFEPKVLHRSVDTNTIFQLVENQMGVAIIPSALCQKNEVLRFVELKDLPQRTTLSAVWKKNEINPALSNFLSLLS